MSFYDKEHAERSVELKQHMKEKVRQPHAC